MTFGIVCPNCGAPSSPSTGICPYCKAVLASTPNGVKGGDLSTIQKKYDEGNLADALALITAEEKNSPERLKNADFVILYVKILLESEEATAKIRSILLTLLAEEPGNALANEYLDIVNAKADFHSGSVDPGAVALAELLKKSPNNVHALFLMGSHMYWENHDLQKSVPYLERCVSLRPTMARAWGSLAAIYKSTGNVPSSRMAAQKFLNLEHDPNMQSFIKREFF